MRHYFWDKIEKVLIAVDESPDGLGITTLTPLGSDREATPPAANAEETIAPAKHMHAKRGAPRNHPWRDGTKGCQECGSPSRHKKSCSKSGAPAVRKSSALESTECHPGVSQMEFGRIKISQSHGVTAEDIACNLDLDLADVEKAFDYETYSEFTKA